MTRLRRALALAGPLDAAVATAVGLAGTFAPPLVPQPASITDVIRTTMTATFCSVRQPSDGPCVALRGPPARSPTGTGPRRCPTRLATFAITMRIRTCFIAL